MPFSTPLSRGGFRDTLRFARAVVVAGSLAGAVGLSFPGALRAQTETTHPLNIKGVDPRRDQITYGVAADLRHRDTDKEARGSTLSATRFQSDWLRKDPRTGAVQGGARVQLYLETDGRRDSSVNRLRASEVYGFYDFALSGVSARAKVGQFVLPFGLMAVYDTPLQLIQPLYEKSLGLRVDSGVMLEGQYGLYLYAVALTTGVGPNRSDADANKAITFRLSRTVPTDLGTFAVGGSLMSGRGPVTSFNTELPASGYSGARRYVDKTRFAGDGQYFFGAVTLRGEVVFGGEAEESVWGYFAEGNYKITPRATLVAFRRLWNFAEKPMASATTGAGIHYDFGKGFLIRALYEFQRDVPLPAGTSPVVVKRLTLQTRLDF